MNRSNNIRKRLSIDTYKIVRAALEGNIQLVETKEDEKYLVALYDKDPGSDFFFGIAKEEVINSTHYIDTVCKPWTNTQNVLSNGRLKIDAFDNKIKEWISHLKIFNERSPFDDLIVKGYHDEFFRDFKIVDPDADESSFEFVQQIKLVGYLDRIAKDLDQFKTEANATLIEEILSDAKKLSEELTTETKNSTMSRLSNIWAKARKKSLKISEYLIKEFAKEFLKKGAESLFNFASENAHHLPQYIDYLTRHSLPQS